MLASQISLWGKRGRGEGAGGKLFLLLAVKPSSCFQRGVARTYAQFGLSLHIFHFYDEWCLDSALKHCESFGQDLQFGIRGVLKLAREVPADIYANLSLSQQNLFANFNKIPMIF